jgi:hypothetical protein
MQLTRYSQVVGISFGLAALHGLTGCGPSALQIDARDVVNVDVRPASQQNLFCPGDPFKVELVAKMKDGTKCSSHDGTRGCLGKEDVIIDPDLVRIEASSGKPGRGFVWVPDEDPLLTANAGLLLRGWVESKGDGQVHKSMVDEKLLTPVYDCMQDNVFTIPQMGGRGEHGAAGPDLRVAVTSLSTPFYPNAALIRVEDGASRAYFISPSADKAIRVLSRGQNGAPGSPGVKGSDGTRGASNTNQPCAKGGAGGDGADGGQGGSGGDGGPGGRITIVLDDAVAEKVRGRISGVSTGGEGGPGGPGGQGGDGGEGGQGGATGPDCTDNKGPDGRDGREGQPGQAGRRGQDGQSPVFSTASRATLFAAELPVIKKIEATPAKK